MSYNLGNWAEKLTCEICGNAPPDLSVPDDYHDPDWDPDGFWDDPPEPYEPDYLPDGIPGLPLPGGGEASPSWNDGPGITLEWPWG